MDDRSQAMANIKLQQPLVRWSEMEKKKLHVLFCCTN